MNSIAENAEYFIRKVRVILTCCTQLKRISGDWFIAHYPKAKLNTNTLLLLRLDAIGDFILWLDAAKEFRKLYPDKRIVLCANALWASLAECFPYWDEVVAVERNRLCFDLSYRLKIMLYLRKSCFQVAIQPTFSREYLLGDSLIRSTGAEQRIGSQGDLSNINELDKVKSDAWYTKLILADALPLMEIKRNAEFISGLGTERFAGSVTKINKLLDLPRELTPGNPYYIVFPGASWEGRMWPASRFSELITRISNLFGWQVILCGSHEEKSICDKIIQMLSCEAINLAGKTSLVELVEVVRGAKLLVGNETAAIHIAAATSTPSVCILGGGHFGRFMPYELEEKRSGLLPIPVIARMDCFGCGWRCIHPMKANKSVPCITNIEVDQVEVSCIKAASLAHDENYII